MLLVQTELLEGSALSTIVPSEDLREGVGRRRGAVGLGWVVHRGLTVMELLVELCEMREGERGAMVDLGGSGCTRARGNDAATLNT